MAEPCSSGRNDDAFLGGRPEAFSLTQRVSVHVAGLPISLALFFAATQTRTFRSPAAAQPPSKALPLGPPHWHLFPTRPTGQKSRDMARLAVYTDQNLPSTR